MDECICPMFVCVCIAYMCMRICVYVCVYVGLCLYVMYHISSNKRLSPINTAL